MNFSRILAAIPFFQSIKGYNLSTFKNDALGGLTVGMIAVPLSMARRMLPSSASWFAASKWRERSIESASSTDMPGPPSTRTTPRKPGSVNAVGVCAMCGADMRA